MKPEPVSNRLIRKSGYTKVRAFRESCTRRCSGQLAARSNRWGVLLAAEYFG
jgi:hypothetical protein